MNMRTILALAAVAVLGVVAYLAVTHVGEPELSSKPYLRPTANH